MKKGLFLLLLISLTALAACSSTDELTTDNPVTADDHHDGEEVESHGHDDEMDEIDTEAANEAEEAHDDSNEPPHRH